MEQWLSPIGVASTVAILFFLAAGTNQMFKLNRNVKGAEPTPLNSTLGAQVETISRDVIRIDGDVRQVVGDVKQLRADISTNGELRKNHMMNHIDEVRKELDKKIDSQTHALNNKIDSSSREQTAQLIAVLKGKHD